MPRSHHTWCPIRPAGHKSHWLKPSEAVQRPTGQSSPGRSNEVLSGSPKSASKMLDIYVNDLTFLKSWAFKTKALQGFPSYISTLCILERLSNIPFPAIQHAPMAFCCCVRYKESPVQRGNTMENDIETLCGLIWGLQVLVIILRESKSTMQKLILTDTSDVLEVSCQNFMPINLSHHWPLPPPHRAKRVYSASEVLELCQALLVPLPNASKSHLPAGLPSPLSVMDIMESPSSSLQSSSSASSSS